MAVASLQVSLGALRVFTSACLCLAIILTAPCLWHAYCCDSFCGTAQRSCPEGYRRDEQIWLVSAGEGDF